eukprot:10209944-Heterocapsa_arctica.AAC.1
MERSAPSAVADRLSPRSADALDAEAVSLVALQEEVSPDFPGLTQRSAEGTVSSCSVLPVAPDASLLQACHGAGQGSGPGPAGDVP